MDYRNIKTAQDARIVMTKLLKLKDIPNYDEKRWLKLVKLSVSDMPLLQLWVRTSGSSNGWTPAQFVKFNKQLPKMVESLDVPGYRGTKLPWLDGKHSQNLTRAKIETKINTFIKNFDNNVPFTIKRITSWTKSRKIAEKFASEGKGYSIVPEFTLGTGFIHIIRGRKECVDVENALLTVFPNKHEGQSFFLSIP